MRKKLLIAALAVLTIVLGFLRDYVFVSINHIIETGNDISGYLLILKWILTVFCSILYMGITCAFLYAIFHSRKYVLIAVSSYVLIFVVAVIIGCIGSITVSFRDVYPLVRAILGITQSPIVMMILIPACLINEQSRSDKN